tara:strand:+ start:2344 stop:3498 length:1155 start_codon:yes stop_codon:yes gene_type:complete
MKNVLLLTENFPPIGGGSGRWFWELYSRLPKDNVTIVTHDLEGGCEFDKSHDLHVIRTPLANPEWGIKSISGLRFYFANVRKLVKLVKQLSIDEIHCGRVIHEGVTAWIVKLLTGTPYRCFVHGEDVETAATSREQSLLVKQVCKHASSLICNSYNSQRLVASLGFSDTDKCDVLHPGVDTSTFKPAPANNEIRLRFGWAKESLVLLTVGRLQKRKGQDFLIEAMPRLLEKVPQLQYVIVGRGDELENLCHLVEKHKLQESVFIHTNFDDTDLINAYQQCDVFILPNRTIRNDIEGFGMVLVEAQACGKSVIAGDSGGTSETLQEGETGFIIDCSSPQAIETALPIALKNCALLQNNKISTHAQHMFNWETHKEKFVSLLASPE